MLSERHCFNTENKNKTCFIHVNLGFLENKSTTVRDGINASDSNRVFP